MRPDPHDQSGVVELAAPDGPPVLIVHTDCDHVTTAKTVCAECGGELNLSNAIHAPGPGAKPGPGLALIGDYITR